MNRIYHFWILSHFLFSLFIMGALASSIHWSLCFVVGVLVGAANAALDKRL